ncbi:MAG: OsmC family protein [Arenicellales bacterium]
MARRKLKFPNREGQIPEGTGRPELAEGEVLVTEEDRRFLRSMYTRSHHLRADEPGDKGGSDGGPDPYDLLLMSLGACTSMTLRMYANHKDLPVENIVVRLRHDRIHAKDCEECETTEGYVSRIERFIHYDGELSDEQHQRLMEIADKCPVHRTLKGEIRIVTRSE